MARVSSDLTTLKSIEPMPKDIYIAHIDKCELTKGKNPPYNPYLNITFKIEGDANGGPSLYTGRTIPFHNVSTGGTGKDGDPINLFRLGNLLECFEVPHTCIACHPEIKPEIEAGTYDGRFDRVSTFHRGTGDDGIPRGQTVCNDCKQPMDVNYDTTSFIGKRARVSVDIGVSLKGQPVNEVKGYAKLG